MVGAFVGSSMGWVAKLIGLSAPSTWSLYAAVGGVAMVAALRPWWRRRRVRQSFERAPDLALVERLRRGDRVRVSGTARARQPPFS